MPYKPCLTRLNLKQIAADEGITQPVEAARLLGRQLELFLRGGTVHTVWIAPNAARDSAEKGPGAPRDPGAPTYNPAARLARPPYKRTAKSPEGQTATAPYGRAAGSPSPGPEAPA